MKKFRFNLIAVLAVFGTILTQSCSDSVKKLHYDIPYNSGDVVVTILPTNNTTDLTTIMADPIRFNVDSFIKVKTGNVLGLKNITSVKLLSVKLTLLDGSDANNFANFESCSASFYSNLNPGPYTVSIPKNPDVPAYTLDLPIDPDAELKSYMQGNLFYYAIGGKLRRSVTASVKCKIEFTYNIVVNS